MKEKQLDFFDILYGHKLCAELERWQANYDKILKENTKHGNKSCRTGKA